MKPEDSASSDARAQIEEPAGPESKPRHGQKAGFRKITTTVPPWAYRRLIEESARRKIAGEPDHLISALLREAITEHLLKTRERPL